MKPLYLGPEHGPTLSVFILFKSWSQASACRWGSGGRGERSRATKRPEARLTPPPPAVGAIWGEGYHATSQRFLWSGDLDSLWDGRIHRRVKGLGDHPLALPARLGIAALMNIEFLDEAGMSLPPWVRRGSHWQEGGGHSDLAELYRSCLSSGFPAVKADRGLWATAALKACLSRPNALTPNIPAVVIGLHPDIQACSHIWIRSQVLPGYLVWMFPWMNRVAEPLPVLTALPGSDLPQCLNFHSVKSKSFISTLFWASESSSAQALSNCHQTMSTGK